MCSPVTAGTSCSCAGRGVRSVAAGLAAQAAGYGPVHNVLQGFEGDVGPDGQRGHTGWRADGLPWRQA